MPKSKPEKNTKPKESPKSKKTGKDDSGKDVKPDCYFLVVDGSTIKNLLELADALRTMSDDVFYYHVTNDRNDFSNWIRDVFEEKELAEELSKLHSKMEAQVAVLRHLLKKLMS